ncbi:MAG: DNA (cytosine-5-)-methyltransferase [Oscillospiraceae bacterium]|nr:DNA (cytosine-5-)-methyltransferase [Oscillospiraceae bacterium]
MIKFFDMFAGIGGFRSGLEKAGGFECVGYCEIDKYAKKAYEAMYDTEREVYYEDARKIEPNEIPDINLICAGFPCQSFSIAGKRGGFDDARGTLFFEIARIAAVKKPKYLLLENVPGLLSHDKGRTFAVILSTLDKLGYDVAWQVLNSADHHVAQSRKRVYIIGFLREKCAGKVLSFTDANPKTLVQRIPGREGCRVYSAEGLSITLTGQGGGFGGRTGLYEILGLPIKVKTKLGYQTVMPGVSYPDLNSRRGRVGHDIAHTLTTSCNQGYYAMCIDMNPDPKVTELARCITTRQDSGIGHHKGEHSGVIVVEGPKAILNPFKPHTRQLGRRVKESNEPMFTLTVTDRHGVIYNGIIRRLMPLECWRLQGFTDEQFNKVAATGMSDAQLYKQAGNAVTVNVIEAIGRNLLEFDKEESGCRIM